MHRVLDIVGVFALGIMLLPIITLTIVCLLAKRQGVIFKQTRIGLQGQPFAMYKFKTMRDEKSCEALLAVREAESNGQVYKHAADPRVTHLGRLLRKTSIDELPQLWNVLVGDMSLVGPRPLMPHMVDFKNDLHRERQSVKPGLTGLWQIRSRHRNTSADEMLSDDLEYVREWFSLKGNLVILCRTIPAIISARGAV
jgi:lipopolysaccharide/colanic/teichoic acid biosynthesis glycosyltransferase